MNAALPTSRVLPVVLSLSPGGTERLVIEMALRLTPEFVRVVCCLDEPGPWADALRDRGIVVVSLGRRPGFHPSLGFRLAEVAARCQARILHCHHYSPFVYGCIAALRHRGAKVIFTEHGRLSDAPPSRKRRLANLVLTHIPAGIFAVSADLQRYLVAEGLSRDRVDVIYNGIEPLERDAVTA